MCTAGNPRESRFQNNNNDFKTNFESPITSLGSFSELTDLEPFKEELDATQRHTPHDQFMSEVTSEAMSDEETILERTIRAKEDVVIFHSDPFTDERGLSTADEIHKDWPYEVERIPRAERVVVDKFDKPERPGNSWLRNKGWCEDHEKLLRKLAVQYKFDWKKIAKKFDNKKYTPHFLKMRYKGYDEGPVPKRVKFSHEEDVLIAKYFDEYGVDWDKMVSHFPNRTAIMLKNRYYSHIRKHNMLDSLLEEAGKEEGVGLNMMTRTEGMPAERILFNTPTPNRKESLRRFGKKLEEQRMEEDISIDEIAQLKAQVKSLKSLYILTHKELNKLKHQGH